MTGTPPWQVAYDQFRQLYPTGGLLLDLVATPTPHFAQYVVKATAQVGNLTLLSVLGEASNLLGAETQACQKLFQVLKLAELSPAASSAAVVAAPPPPLDLQASVAPPPEPFTPAPVSPPAAALGKDDRPAGMNAKNSLPSPNSAPKSEPYRLPQPLSREEIMAPEVDDWSEELAQIDAEIKRLGWSAQQESQYLQERYGKLSRDHITDYGELLQFLTDLQGQPSPQRKIEPWSPNATPHPHPPVPPWSREEMMDKVLAEIRRIGWNKQKGSEYLQQTYHVKTRQELTNDQLHAFILYLQNHP
ncbi:MAG: hypothetical protein ACO3EZ_13180 [Prochlorotrichaceae cyanobacterium]